MATLHTVIEQSFYKIPNKDLYQEVITHWLIQKDNNNNETRRSVSKKELGKIFIEHTTDRSAEGEVQYKFPDGNIRRLIALNAIRVGDAIKGTAF